MLHFSRQEILWSFMHENCLPDNRRMKLVKDDRLDELVHLSVELFGMVKDYAPLVTEYCSEFLLDVCLQKAKDAIQAMKTGKSSTVMSDYMRTTMEYCEKFKSDPTALELMRVKWTHAMAFFSSTQARGTRDPLTKAGVDVLNQIVYFSRFIDKLHLQMIDVGSLKDLFYFREPLTQLFERSLELP
eukprot:59116_1